MITALYFECGSKRE